MAPHQPLRECLVTASACMQQLTAPYLVAGYYPLYSLCTSIGLCIVATAMTCCNSGALFTGGISFCACVIVALMTMTGLYRLLGGAFSTRHMTKQVEWMFDVIIADNMKRVYGILLGDDRKKRIAFIVSVGIVGEVGKLLSFSAFVAVASLMWTLWLLYAHRLQYLREVKHALCN